MSDGRELRIAYAMTMTALPDPRPRSKWQEIAPFGAADEVLAEPKLKTVFKKEVSQSCRDRSEDETMRSPLGVIFTIEVDGKPAVAFEARQLREAAELSKEAWFRADLNSVISNGVPLCAVGSKLKARIANEAEREIYRAVAEVTEASDDILFVYLVELDGIGTEDDTSIDAGGFPPKR
jgi:hypothetical protein